MIHLTFDQDWAPAWATRTIHDRLRRAGLEGTLFVTQDCPSLADARTSGVLELGWHPNFLPGSSHGGSIDEVLDTLAGWVPEAVGARAHCLVRGTPFLQAYGARGLLYDAADLHDGVPGLEPFQSWTGLVRVPIWFEDDVHLSRGRACTLETLDLESPGLKVCTFHPVLVALNVADLGAYGDLKADLSERGVALPDATEEDFGRHRQDEVPGVGDLLESLIGWLEVHRDRCGGPLRRLVQAGREPAGTGD
ncbi:MAG: hypothetical protein ACQEXJ_19850 [Myxococcota bacterium]